MSPSADISTRYRNVEAPLRLASDLVLFAYAAGHFLSHASGAVFQFEGMELVDSILLAPWGNDFGQIVLYAAFGTHAALGLRALYRRRTLRMPRKEAWQLALGLIIPLILIDHVVNVRLAELLYGFDNSYLSVVHHYFVEAPIAGIGQSLLLLVVWCHGCLGLHFWLRFRPWYRRAQLGLLPLAILVPVVALLGLYDAGFEAEEAVVSDPSLLTSTNVIDAATAEARLDLIAGSLTLGYVGLVVGILLLRIARDARVMRTSAVRLAYPGGTTVVVPSGFSVLEASRFARIPHMSMCGGRARCSTCRIRVITGAAHLPPPNAAERQTLERIGAGPGVRLACQLRPDHDLTVAPLLTSNIGPSATSYDPFEAGQERQIAALFVDLRDSTKLAENRLPFDTLFLIDQYVQTVTRAVEDSDGRVIVIAGDGVMAIFGASEPPRTACRNALKAAAAIIHGVERLNEQLSESLDTLLRFGIGIHTGLAVVGQVDRYPPAEIPPPPLPEDRVALR